MLPGSGPKAFILLLISSAALAGSASGWKLLDTVWCSLRITTLTRPKLIGITLAA